jgi:hypothetical protein
VPRPMPEHRRRAAGERTSGRSRRLSAAQRLALERLRDAEAREDYDEAEIVGRGLVWYIGTDTIAAGTVRALLRIMAISDRSIREGGKYPVYRYAINETGRACLRDEKQIAAVITALDRGGSWTWQNGKLVRIK